MSLLQDLLEIVSEENLTTPALLARRLNVSQGLVELMLADLEKAGYLQTMIGGCNRCESGICHPTKQNKGWRLLIPSRRPKSCYTEDQSSRSPIVNE